MSLFVCENFIYFPKFTCHQITVLSYHSRARLGSQGSDLNSSSGGGCGLAASECCSCWHSPSGGVWGRVASGTGHSILPESQPLF